MSRFGFRRAIRIGKLLHVNFSKSGVGISVGIPGLHVGVSPKRGAYLRAGLPGTGVYYRRSLGKTDPAKPVVERGPR